MKKIIMTILFLSLPTLSAYAQTSTVEPGVYLLPSGAYITITGSKTADLSIYNPATKKSCPLIKDLSYNYDSRSSIKFYKSSFEAIGNYGPYPNDPKSMMIDITNMHSLESLYMPGSDCASISNSSGIGKYKHVHG